MDAPSRPSYSLPLQSHPYLDITLSLLPITPFDHILDTPLPPSPSPQPQPPLMGKNVDLSPNQVLAKEVNRDMKRWEELIHKNVFGLGGNRDHLSACLAHMMYCIVAKKQYNLAYFVSKRIKHARATSKANLPNDYSLWEVILNGDSPPPTKIVDGDVQIIASNTAEQRLDKKIKLKARGTLLMAVADKHQLKFNIHKDAKSLMEAIENRFGAEVKGSSSSSQNTQNIAFVSSNNTENINDSVTAASISAPSIFAASSKAKSNSPRLDSEDLKQINPDDLEEIDLKWQMAMLTLRARRFLKRTGRNLGANGIDAIGFDMSKVECYNCHIGGHFSRECRSPRDNRNKETTRRTVSVEVSTSNVLVSQCDAIGGNDWSFQADEEPTNYAIMAYASPGSSSSSTSDNEDIKLLKLDVMLRDNSLVELRKKLEKAKKERSDLKLTLGKFQTFSKNLSKLLESQVSNKIGLGFYSQVLNSQVFDCEEFHSHESDNRVPKNPKNDRYKTGEGYHVVPLPNTGTFLPPKPDLVFTDDPNASESVANVFNDESTTNKPSKDMSKTFRPDAPIVEDWISDSEDNIEIELVPTAVTQSSVKSTWPVKHVVHKAHSPIRRVTRVMLKKPQHTRCGNQNVKGNPQQVLKDKSVIDNGCSRHMTKNISFLSNFKEIDGGYVSFRGNPKGGKIFGKGKIKTGKLDFDDVYFIKELKFNLFSVSQMCDKKNSVPFTYTECVVLSSDFKLPDENHVLLRVLRENNMYNVDLKNVVPSVDLTCLFAKAILDESNLWRRRLRHINLKTMNKLVKGNLVRGLPSNIFKNNHTCVACQKGKLHKASCKSKPVSSISQPLQRLHMDLFGPTFVKSLNKKSYCQVVTDDYSRSPSIGFMRPFGCLVTILNTLDPLGKFDGKADEGFLVGYSINSKAFKVFNSRTRIVKETLHITFLKNKPNVAGIGSKWLFDIDTLTMSINYQPVVAGNQPNDNAGIKENLDANKVGKETVSAQQYTLIPLCAPVNAVGPNPTNNTNSFNTASPSVNTVSPNFRVDRKSLFVDPSKYHDDPDKPELEDIVYSDDEEDVGAEADLSNLEIYFPVSLIPTTRVHKDHLVNQIIGDLNSAPQTRSMTRMVKEQGGLHQINDEDFHTCMFACFLSQIEPKKVLQELKDPSWTKAMQEELQQFKLQKDD
uniref:Putative ribonuclease H-like domain-containing protein n=1 Tax=Tanacetum cinerariifolium TaxID=118510 RepID=A0A6L2L450_TANCI|nr:putative ribonuclease H-like domain-containing protein [Tanacetum cinerariifolium]